MSSIPHAPLPETRPLAAAGSVVAGMALIGLIDSLIVLIADLGGLWQFHLIRTAMALPLLLVLARVMDQRLRPLRPVAVAVRSVLLATSMVLYFGALAFMPVGEAAAGLFTAPIFVLLISVLALGERVGPRRLAAVAIGFAGVLLVLRPEAGGLKPASLMPLAGAVFYALAAIATRRHCARESTLTLLFGFFAALGAWGALGCTVLAIWQPVAPEGAAGFLLRGWTAPDAEFLFWTAVQAVGSIIGIGLLTRAYLLAEASFVAGFEYSLLIFAALWGWVLWGQVLSPWALVGIALIIGSGIVLARRGGRG